VELVSRSLFVNLDVVAGSGRRSERLYPAWTRRRAKELLPVISTDWRVQGEAWTYTV